LVIQWILRKDRRTEARPCSPRKKGEQYCVRSERSGRRDETRAGSIQSRRFVTKENCRARCRMTRIASRISNDGLCERFLKCDHFWCRTGWTKRINAEQRRKAIKARNPWRSGRKTRGQRTRMRMRFGRGPGIRVAGLFWTEPDGVTVSYFEGANQEGLPVGFQTKLNHALQKIMVRAS